MPLFLLSAAPNQVILMLESIKIENAIKANAFSFILFRQVMG